MKDIHTVSIVGLGAIGSYFAEKIQPVLKDNLRIIAGSRRKEQLEKEGRIINSHQRFFHLVSPEENTGYSDLVLVCSKMTGLKQALKDAGNQIGPETIILTPLNGVESEEVAAAMYGRDQVLYSLMRVSSVKSGNQITFDPEVSYIEFGEQINDPNALSPKVQKVKEFFDLAAIPSVIRPDMLRAIWEKYICNVSENQVSAVLNIPFGAWGACTDADRLRILTAGEVIQIARKKRNSYRRKLCRKASGPSQKTSPWQHAIHPSGSPGRPQNRGGNVRWHHPAHGKRAGYTHTF